LPGRLDVGVEKSPRQAFVAAICIRAAVLAVFSCYATVSTATWRRKRHALERLPTCGTGCLRLRD